MKYFTIKELTSSDTAKKLKIDNTPSEEIIEKLIFFVEEYLDPIREAWGSPIIITSGYRCPKLNDAVNGSKTSSHKDAEAVDMKPKNGKRLEFHNFVLKWLLDTGKPFDQLINEKPKNKIPSWTHLGIGKKMRHQNLILK